MTGWLQDLLRRLRDRNDAAAGTPGSAAPPSPAAGGAPADDEDRNSPALPLFARAYFAAVCTAGLACIVYSAIHTLQNRGSLRLFDWVFLGALTLIVGSHPVRLPGARGSVSVSDTFVFLSVMMFGPEPAALLAGLDGMFGTKGGRRSVRLTKVVFNMSVLCVSVWISGHLYKALLEASGATVGLATGPNQVLVPVSLLVLTHYLLNSMGVAVVVALHNAQPVWRTWKDGFLWTSVSYFAGGSAAAGAYLFVHRWGFATFAALLPILFITYYTYKIYLEKVEDKNKHILELATVHLSTIESLAMAIDAKDQMTHGHVRRVQAYAVELARLLGVRDEELEGLRAAALLHDIGKLAVPDYILNKPGRLTPSEFQKMKIHPTVGADILRNVNFPYPVLPVVRHHHERFDGSGYPDGLNGERIPLGARILAVVDCYEALRANRSYRARLSREEAVRMLKEEAGTHFDPAITQVFCDHLEEIEERVTSVERKASWAREAAARSLSPVGTPPGEPGEAGEERPSVLNEITSAHKEVFALYEIAQTLGSSLNLTDTLVIIVSKIEKLIPFSTCIIYLVDSMSRALVAEYTSGRHAHALKGRPIALGEGITGASAATHRPKFSTNPELDFPGLDPQICGEYRSVAVFPLVHDNKVLGAISLYSGEPHVYSDDHSRIMDIISKLAAGAIHNARIFEQTQESALTDALTALPNSRYLHMQFDQEMSKAKRHRQSMAILAMDLEDFKAVNDRFGHYAGDQLLIEVSRTLKTQMRGGDTLCRYAGDEFIAILPMTERAEAMLLIDRLQTAVGKLRFRVPGVVGHAQVGVSIGAAFFPGDGETLETLMIKADRQMYRNKSQRKKQAKDGAGRVVAFSGKGSF